MTYSADMNATLYSILNQNSGRTAATTFTSTLQTVKISSEHFGVANHEMHIESVSVRYVPHGDGEFRCSWEFDNQGTSGQTITQNPLAYSIMGTNSTVTTFTLATDLNDSTASDMVRDDDSYVQEVDVQGQGKTFEFTISVSDESQPVFTGMQVEARLVKSDAYVGGAY